MIVSALLLAELGEVLARPKFERWSGNQRGGAYVAGFAARGERHPDPPAAVAAGVRDPEDEYLVALTRAAGADSLVSVDRDLLEAGVDDLLVLNPAGFLDRLAQS